MVFLWPSLVPINFPFSIFHSVFWTTQGCGWRLVPAQLLVSSTVFETLVTAKVTKTIVLKIHGGN